MLKIAHLTSAHPRSDTRIFVKQCSSLSKIYETYLVVADGKGNEIKDRVNILDVGKFNGRKNRMLNAPKAVFEKALTLEADIYHLHDPELIPIGLKLKKCGKKVIFDAHEDLPNQIMSKHYLNPISKKLISFLVKAYEKYACAKLDGVVTATPFIRDKFLNINKHSIDINNYPRLKEFKKVSTNYIKEKKVCYVGGISNVRGGYEMVSALSLISTDSILELAGDFPDSKFETKLRSLDGWKKVKYLGYVDREQINQTLSSSIAGLVVLHPTTSYLDALPVKMFEYMCAGIPVISSNFPLWKSIVDEAQCGVCVDPLESLEIANAIDYFVNNPDVAKNMGENGKKAVLEKYNWNFEEQKLFDFYKQILRAS